MRPWRVTVHPRVGQARTPGALRVDGAGYVEVNATTEAEAIAHAKALVGDRGYVGAAVPIGPAPVAVTEAWRERGSCFRRHDLTETFFPPGEREPAYVRMIERAKAICAECAVSAECLEFAMEQNDEEGIYGGTTPSERRKMRKLWLARRRRSA